jgi:fructokinase
MAGRRFTIVGLGEILWDLLPDGKQLGGAPANFAYMCNLLGDQGIVASRVGNDSLGIEAQKALSRAGLAASYLQPDSTHSTGTVKVDVSKDGQPSFEIVEPVAWDFLEWTPQWQELAARADAVCFGSLAQRSAKSRETICRFLSATRPNALRIFDVNLRQAFFSPEILTKSMKMVAIVKLNHEELPRVLELLGLSVTSDVRLLRQKLLVAYELELLCITRGEKGSLLITRDDAAEHPGFAIQVADTIGAGDAFTAGLVYGYLRGSSLTAMNEAANRLGSLVASYSGGTPALNEEQLQQVRRCALLA